MIRRLRTTVAGLLLLAGTSGAWAQRPPSNQPDMTIDGPTRSRVVDGALKAPRRICLPRRRRQDGRSHQGPRQVQGL